MLNIRSSGLAWHELNKCELEKIAEISTEMLEIE